MNGKYNCHICCDAESPVCLSPPWRQDETNNLQSMQFVIEIRNMKFKFRP